MIRHVDFLVAAAVIAGLWTGAAPAQDRAAGGPFVEATLSIDREPLYEREPFGIILTIRSRGVRLGSGFEPLGFPPRDVLERGTPEELPVQREVDGRFVREVRRFRYPARVPAARTVNLDLTLRAGQIVRRRMLLGSSWIEQPLVINVPPLTLDVKPVPTRDRPVTFSGAVGSLEFNVDVDPLDVAVGDLVRVTLDIRGEGDLSGMIPPRLDPGPAFRGYPPRVRIDEPDHVRLEQVLVPLGTHAVAVPAVPFTYFDPRREAFVTATRGPWPLTFHAPRETARVNVYRGDESGDATPGAVAGAPAPGVGPVIVSDATGRLAPAAGAWPTLDIPAGTPVRILEAVRGWVMIAVGRHSAWVPRDSVVDLQPPPG